MDTVKPKESDGPPVNSGPKAREIRRWVEEEPDKLLEIFCDLPFAEQLSVLLLTSGQLRQDLILSTPFAGELVPLLPEQEVYLTLKEIGIEDALPLLALMNREQVHYVNDLDTWKSERFQAQEFLKLLKVIHQCGEDRLADWLDAVDPELLVLFLKKYGWVDKFDVTKDPLEEAAEHIALTYDGYYRYHPRKQEFAPIVDPVLRILKTTNPERFGMVMESAYRDLPAEVETEALRFRSSRLSEKGMPDFEEACEIYRPLTDERFRECAAEMPATTGPTAMVPVLYPIRWLPTESFFREVLATLADHSEMDRIRMELAALGNKVLIADGMEVAGEEPLRAALKKVADTLTVALEYLADRDVQEAASWLTRSWLHYLFRLGYGQIHELAERARRLWVRAGFPWIDRFHSLLDSPLEDALRGLLKPRPLFFEPRGREYDAAFRDFKGTEDLRVTSARIVATEAIGELFEKHLHLSAERIKQTCIEVGLGDQLDRVRWSQVLQTVWAHRRLTGNAEFRPLSPPELRQFMGASFVAAPGTSAKKLDPSFSQTLLLWVSDRTGPLGDAPRGIIEEWIRSGTRKVEEELGGLAPGQPVDSRFVSCLCIREHPFPEGQR